MLDLKALQKKASYLISSVIFLFVSDENIDSFAQVYKAMKYVLSMKYKTFFTHVTQKFSYMDWDKMKKKQTFFAIITIFLAFSFNIYGAGDITETDI